VKKLSFLNYRRSEPSTPTTLDTNAIAVGKAKATKPTPYPKILIGSRLIFSANTDTALNNLNFFWARKVLPIKNTSLFSLLT
jgi:hypothetical protein